MVVVISGFGTPLYEEAITMTIIPELPDWTPLAVPLLAALLRVALDWAKPTIGKPQSCCRCCARCCRHRAVVNLGNPGWVR